MRYLDACAGIGASTAARHGRLKVDRFHHIDRRQRHATIAVCAVPGVFHERDFIDGMLVFPEHGHGITWRDVTLTDLRQNLLGHHAEQILLPVDATKGENAIAEIVRDKPAVKSWHTLSPAARFVPLGQLLASYRPGLVNRPLSRRQNLTDVIKSLVDSRDLSSAEASQAA